MNARLIAVVLILALSGCAAQKPDLWVRADGKPDIAQQNKLDVAACNGEVAKARLSSGVGNGGPGLFQQIDAEVDRSRATRDVFVGCMAGKGYSHAAQ